MSLLSSSCTFYFRCQSHRVCVCKRWMWCDQLVSEASSGEFLLTPSDRSVWELTFEDGLMSEGHKSWWTESVGCICFLLKYSRLYIKDWCRRCDITHGLAVLRAGVTCWGGWIRLRDLVAAHWECSHRVNRHRRGGLHRQMWRHFCCTMFGKETTVNITVLPLNIRNKWKKTNKIIRTSSKRKK